ncbi:hypothetical protein [Kitasatospora sp. NBC_00315]|uniref:hypothetical protein n=1 Tax=Kitasatospora sp. NBC_00315 TaxID=2975963 RepID=UPI00324D783C
MTRPSGCGDGAASSTTTPLADHGTARIAAAGEIPGLDPISGTATSGDQVFLTPRD